MLATLFIPDTMNIELATLLGFAGGAIGLALMVGGVFVGQSILVFRKQRDEARNLYEPIKELADIKTGHTINNKDINVSLMFEQLKSDHLHVVTFDHCVLRGPCMIAFEGDSKLHGCNLGDNLPNKLIKFEEDKRYFGVGVFTHCTFNFCKFVNLSFLMHEKLIEKTLREVVQS